MEVKWNSVYLLGVGWVRWGEAGREGGHTSVEGPRAQAGLLVELFHTCWPRGGVQNVPLLQPGSSEMCRQLTLHIQVGRRCRRKKRPESADCCQTKHTLQPEASSTALEKSNRRMDKFTLCFWYRQIKSWKTAEHWDVFSLGENKEIKTAILEGLHVKAQNKHLSVSAV